MTEPAILRGRGRSPFKYTLRERVPHPHVALMPRFPIGVIPRHDRDFVHRAELHPQREHRFAADVALHRVTTASTPGSAGPFALKRRDGTA